MNSAKKNYIYNLIYQILLLVIPLIITPYLSRTIGVEGIGVYSYTYSIVYYFMLLSLLGVNNYGNRTIAKVRTCKEELSKTFWSIYTIQLFMGVLMLFFYMTYLMASNNYFIDIARIQSLFIISAILDINWFFFGLEQFKKTITRNAILKVGSVILIVVFVKEYNDLWKYTLIMSGSMLLSQLILWGFLKKYISFYKISLEDIVKHIKPNIILFIPVVAISIYKMMDKVMLGIMLNVSEVGYYENAMKIIQIPLTLISSLGVVMLPRVSNLVANGEKSKLEEYLKKSLNFVMFMSFAMCAGLIAISYNFAPIYFGESFQKSGVLIMLLSLTLPLVSFANVIRTQYLIPNEKDKVYIISVILGAIINIILNAILIPRLASVGACLATIVAEFTVMFCQSFIVRKEIQIYIYLKNGIPFFVKSVVMLIIVDQLKYLKIDSLFIVLLQIIIGALIYVMMNLKYLNSIVDFKRSLKINRIIER